MLFRKKDFPGRIHKKQPMKLKRFLAAALSLLALFAVFVPVLADGETDEKKEVAAEPHVENCHSAYLYCFENARTLFEYNADLEVYPTSTTKLMTGIVAAEHFAGRFDEKITVTADMISNVSGNKLSPALVEDEIVTVEDMLYGTLVGGANDAASVLAFAVSGSVSAFVDEMNKKAGSSSIGARSTRYTNPTGMHDDAMVTTARDTAQIALYLMANDELARIVQTPKYVMEETNKQDFRNIYNRNAAISKYYTAGYYDERAIGANAGGTPVGGYSAVEVFRDQTSGATYLAVVMGADENEDGTVMYSYKNAADLMEWAFASYAYVSVLSEDKVVDEIPVTLSSTVDFVTLRPAKTVTVFLPTSIDPERDLELHFTKLLDSLAAPVRAGDVVGTVTVTLGDDIVGTTDLVTTGDVDRSEFLYVLSQIEDFTKSKFFIATLVCVVVLTLVYIFGTAFIRGRKSRKL